MAKRRTLKRHWLEEKERADKLEKKVKDLKRQIRVLNSIREEQHPIVKLKYYMDVDAREFDEYEDQVKARIARGMFGLDDDDNPTDGFRCIKFEADPAPYPRHYLGFAESLVRVTAEIDVLNMNDARRCYHL